jgi:nicotinamide mononucleotide transporter
VYPVGLVSTVIYIYLSLKGNLLGEASVNFYYTVMSIYGWMLWARKDNQKHETILHISYSSRKEWIQQLGFFAVFYIVIFASLTWAKQSFAPEAIPWADAFASASAYTGMWLMTKKKIENWIWWIITDLASVPLYFVKGYAFSSFQFAVFTVMAVWGLVEWRKRVLNRGILNKEQKNK